VILTLLFVYWPASVQNLSRFGEDLELDVELTPPSYIEPFAPPFSHSKTYRTEVKSIDSAVLDLLPNFGADRTEFKFKDPDQDRTAWDVNTLDQIPAIVFVSRSHFGWPFRAMHYDIIMIDNGGTREHIKTYFGLVENAAGINIGLETPKWWPAGETNYRLPLKPIWIGFVLNAILFASIWITLACLTRKAITSSRKRKGLCAACKYELQDLATCPECGTE
jgi:hypothetical protein